MLVEMPFPKFSTPLYCQPLSHFGHLKMVFCKGYEMSDQWYLASIALLFGILKA